MKFLFLALLSFSAFAEVPAFTPKYSTCSEIQNSIELHGSVLINVKYIFGTAQYETFQVEPECDAFHMSRKMKVKTSEGLKCFVGYYCDEMVNP